MKSDSLDSVTAGASAADSAHLALQRRLRLQSFCGILLTLILVGAVASYQLYDSRRTATLEHLQQDTRIGALALDAKFSQFTSITRQVTSRSVIRRFLERYNRGEIGLAALQAESVSRLRDAISISPEVVGVTRLDRNNIPVIEVGTSIPDEAWPGGFTQSQLRTGLPFSADGKLLLAISAPILAPDNRRAGTDLVLFDINEVGAISAAIASEHDHGASVAFSVIRDGEVLLFDIAGRPPQNGILENNPIIRHHLAHGVNEELHEISDPTGAGYVLIHAIIDSPGWQLILLAPSSEVLAPVRLNMAYLLATMLVLVVIGTLVTARLTRPTLGKIMVSENELRELNERNRELLTKALDNKRVLDDVVNHSDSVIFIKDLEGHYILVNEAYAAERKLSAADVIGKTDHDFHPPEVAQMFRENDRKALEARQPIVIEELVELDGVEHLFVTTKFPLMNHDNEIYALCGIATDVTDMRRAEQLRLELEAAEAANEAKSAFLANMSHELRTPLHGILSFSEIGGKRSASVERDKLEKYFNNIEISGRRLLMLLNDLLDLSKLEAGKLELVYDRCDLMQVIEECIEEQIAAISERSLHIRRHNHGANLQIDCDRERMFQVVRNLLNNAIKFSPPEGRIDFEFFAATEGEDMIELHVTDDGSGINMDENEMIFDKFAQSGNNPNEGSGLGLSICREIVELHGGSIRAQNSDNRGATLIVRLPCRKPGAET